MSSPNNPQRFLSLSAVPHSRFLSLAPATSPSYPKKPVAGARTHTRAAAPTSSQAPVPGRASGGYRILKLGPVHYGEHQDDHKADFHEVILN